MDVEQIVQRRGGGAQWLLAIVRLDDRGSSNAHRLVHWRDRWADTMQSLLVPEDIYVSSRDYLGNCGISV